MKDSLFKQLFDLRKDEAKIQKKVDAILTKAAPFQAELKDILSKQKEVKEAILQNMKENNVKNYVYEGHNAISQVRKTLTIADEIKTMHALMENEDLPMLTGLSKDKLKDELVIEKLNTTKAKDFAQSLLDIGSKVDGVEIQETNYLTIKE